jgi:two-component system cell cycle response regulator
MSLKILTVDDSKAVRMIVKKAFKLFDCEVLEAANGVEGLETASSDAPDLILLDVTMPVMDGVEMLTKLKADPQTKGIPVVMLTAEAGRENVMKIAKIGIRDYIVKPFKEDVLIEKAGRIVDLQPKESPQKRPKQIDEAIELLVVEDKAAIIKQLEEGLAAHVPWKITGVETAPEATAYCQENAPDAIVLSLTLPDEGAFELFRTLRSNPKTKHVPIFGLSVKTATAEQQRAQEAGFTCLITKPIDFTEMISKIARSANLDTSSRFFASEADIQFIRMPALANDATVSEIEAYVSPKLTEAVDNGLSQVIVDASKLEKVDTGVIKLFCAIAATCSDLTLPVSFVAGETTVKACHQFEESQEWRFADSVEAIAGAPAGA